MGVLKEERQGSGSRERGAYRRIDRDGEGNQNRGPGEKFLPSGVKVGTVREGCTVCTTRCRGSPCVHKKMDNRKHGGWGLSFLYLRCSRP